MRRQSIPALALLFTIISCAAPTIPTDATPTIHPAITVDALELGTDAAIEKYLSGRELDPIEGAWVHDKNVYEIVIAKNTFGIEPSYQYVGIITRAERGSWKPGQVKLLMRETASESLFTGVWFMGNKSRQNISFMVENQNLVKVNIYSADGNTFLIRIYPKNDVQGGPQEVASSGTGFFVSSDGLVLTNNHVVEDAKDVFIFTPAGDRLKAKIVAQSKATDLALLKVPYIANAFLELASANSATIGDHVFTIGYPSKDILGGEAKYSEGVINALSGMQGDVTFFQISVPVQPGNSGGPLIDRNGRAIGIVTATAAISTFIRATGTLPQNVNWAVKADYAPVLSPSLQLTKKETAVTDPIQHAKRSSVFVEVTR